MIGVRRGPVNAPRAALLVMLVLLLTGCSSSDRSTLGLKSNARAYFFGDSLVRGYSATANHGFADLTAEYFDWTLVPSPDGSGSGFVHAYPGSAGTYPVRAAALPQHIDADVVVIEGGLNDVGFDLAGYGTAVDTTISILRAKVGNVPVVLVGPPAVQFPVNASVQRVDALLRRAAARDHVRYISPLREEWITAANVGQVIDPTTSHPDDPGHAYIASRLEHDLTAAP